MLFFFEYNDQGLRISKKDYRGVGSKYYYDGDKLITEVAPSYRLDFLYDENDMLYGFVYNNSDKYYYVRDFMQNILGIIDSTGSLVVKYGYTAYGQITSISGSLAGTIGAYNPFKYKGYYYDTETSMYYCKSRYYVPEWCRWLNADHISYLDLDDINGTNLFCYCKNNPITLYDLDGTFNWGKLFVVVAASLVVVAAVATTIVTCGATSVAGTIAITSAITLAARTAEVAGLQIKKSIKEGDNGQEIFSDTIDAIFGNSGYIIGKTPVTKTAGFASGFYTQSNIFANVRTLMKVDGFSFTNFVKGAGVAVKDRFKNFKTNMKMPTSKLGYIIAYGFAAITVITATVSICSNDPEERAKKRKIVLY